MEVDAGVFECSPNDPPCFTMFQGAVRIQLVLVDPFAGDDILTSGGRGAQGHGPRR